MRAHTAIVLLVAAAFVFTAPLVYGPQSDADGVPASETITGDITESMVFADGVTAEIQGDAVLAEGVTLTFEPGSAFAIDLKDSKSLSGGAGSGLVFMAGSSISVAGKELPVTGNVMISIDGRIAYDRSASEIALNVQGGTVMGVGEASIAFEDGLSVTAAAAGDLPEMSDLKALADGDLTSFDLDADVSISTGRIVVAYGDAEAVVEGSTAISAEASGSEGSLSWNGSYTVSSGTESLVYSSDIGMSFLFTSDGITVTEGSAEVRADCDEMSLGSVLILSGIHAEFTAAIADGRADSHISMAVEDAYARSTDGHQYYGLEGMRADCDLDFDCRPLIQAVFSPPDNPVQLLTDARVELSGDASFASASAYDDGGNFSSTTINGFSATFGLTAGEGISASISAEVDYFGDGGSSDNSWMYVSSEGLSIEGTYGDGLYVSLTSPAMMYERLESGYGQGIYASGSLEISADILSGPTAEFRGDIDIQTMNAGSEVAYYRIVNADVTAAITGDSLDNLDFDLESFEGAVTIDISNIVLDCGSVTYDPVTERFGSAEVRVSGKSADPYSDLDTVEGTITDISSTPDWECTFDSHDLTYTLRDGASVRDTVTVSGDAVSETLEVSGTVNYETVNGISSIFALMTANATAGRHIDLRTGGGHLVMSSFDDSRYSVAGGEVFLDGVYWKGDLSVFVYTLNGAYLILHSNGDMGIEAKPGYTLDPSTYSGFSVDGGKVVFDETKITDGKLYLEAVCIGDTYRLTLDGSTSDVVYGSMVTLKVPPEVLWIVDSEEKVYGSIRDGEWEYIYSFLGDLELRSIRGEEVIVSPEDVPKASSNAFYFDLPENGEVVTVEAPSGLFFTVTDPGSFSGSRAMISHTETVYNGYRAYEIKANGHITVVFPVKDLDTVLYHVVNGVPVEMNTIPLGGQDQAFLMADLSSFSIYYLTEPAPPVPPGPESQDDAPESLAVILAAVMIVLSLALMLSWKRK